MKRLFAACMIMLISSYSLSQGLYLGGGVEKAEFIAEYDTSTEMEIATVNIGYDFNQYLGIEAQASTGLTEGKWPYFTVGACGPDNCNADTSVDSIVGAYATGTFLLGDRVSITGKAGYASTRGSIDLNTNNSENRLDQNGLSYGAGINFRLLPKSDIQLSYMRTSFSDNDENMDYLERLGIHFNYHF